MRIISGKYRGKKLCAPNLDSDIRPTSDRAKESLFNILFNTIDSSSIFIDLFAGSGGIGIEALSRGVKKVYFIDKSKESIALIKKNIAGIDGDYEILEMDYKKALKYIKSKGQDANLIYCDPPYNKNMGEELLENIKQSNVMEYGGIVVIERNATFETVESKYFQHYDKRKYATSVMDFYKREKRVAITGTFDPFTNGHMDLVIKARELFDRIYIVLLINKDKQVRYSVEKRKEMIDIALKGEKKNIIIESYDGYAIDYCNKNDIQYILRGVRSPKELAYEQEMAEYNFRNGEVTTIIMPAKHNEISSTLVKKSLDTETDLKTLVDEGIIELLKE